MFVTENPFCQIEKNFLNDDLSSWVGSGAVHGRVAKYFERFLLKAPH